MKNRIKNALLVVLISAIIVALCYYFPVVIACIGFLIVLFIATAAFSMLVIEMAEDKKDEGEEVGDD